MKIFIEYALTFGWAITGAVSMAIALGIGLKVYDWLTPINEWEEIRKGNLGVAMVTSAVIIAFGIVVGLIVN